MTENEIAERILDEAFAIHRETGPGLLESVYETMLEDALAEKGIAVRRQLPIPFKFRGKQFDEGFRADLVVESAVIIELKSVKALEPIHAKQLLTYLKLSGLKLGILINFNEVLLRNGIRRVANGVEEPPPRESES